MSEDQGGSNLLDRLREIGPAGIVLGVLLVGAVVAVLVVAASGGVEDEAAGPDTAGATETTVPDEAVTEPLEPLDDAPAVDEGELRQALDSYLQCLADVGIRARMQDFDDTTLVIGVRAGSGAAQAMTTDEAAACAEEHVAEHGRTVTVVEVERGVDTTVGGGDATSGVDDGTTDSTEPPGRPTTDATTP